MATTAVAEHVGGPEHQQQIGPVLTAAPVAAADAEAEVDATRRLRGAMLVASILCLQVAWVGAILYAAWLVVF